eukprot:Skav230042  [mRNA]  locus=scaffold465:193451:197803:+ [translate_table: standard]
MELEQKRRDDFEKKQMDDLAREERLMAEAARRSGDPATQEAMRRAEDRRNAILDQQEETETEYRLMEHEAKKAGGVQRPDNQEASIGLRSKNKEINVERQRRREEHERESIADAVKKKDVFDFAGGLKWVISVVRLDGCQSSNPPPAAPSHRQHAASSAPWFHQDEKIDQLNAERQRMWELRRAAQAEAYKAREAVKTEILRQRIASAFDSKKDGQGI